jgi:hypothetical protein
MEALQVIGGVLAFFGILSLGWLFRGWSTGAIGDAAIRIARNRRGVSDRDDGRRP